MGSVTPHLGGGSFRYDPLPAALVTRRRRLRFVYFDGAGLRALSFAAVRGSFAPTDDQVTPDASRGAAEPPLNSGGMRTK